jgi:hypothetical protein
MKLVVEEKFDIECYVMLCFGLGLHVFSFDNDTVNYYFVSLDL